MRELSGMMEMFYILTGVMAMTRPYTYVKSYQTVHCGCVYIYTYVYICKLYNYTFSISYFNGMPSTLFATCSFSCLQKSINL